MEVIKFISLVIAISIIIEWVNLPWNIDKTNKLLEEILKELKK